MTPFAVISISPSLNTQNRHFYYINEVRPWRDESPSESLPGSDQFLQEMMSLASDTSDTEQLFLSVRHFVLRPAVGGVHNATDGRLQKER